MLDKTCTVGVCSGLAALAAERGGSQEKRTAMDNKIIGRIGSKIDKVDNGFLIDGKVSECWIWNGYVDKYGYGMVKIDGAKIGAHRVTFALFNEDLIDGMHVDHLCRNRACCNPNHLEQVTPVVNTRRGSVAVLTVEVVANVKAFLIHGYSVVSLARMYGVSAKTIANVAAGRTWKDVAPNFAIMEG